MKAKLVVNGVETILGHEELDDICYQLADTEKNQVVFAELAKHPSAKIRRKVADQACLDPETVQRLLHDSCIDVVRAVVVRSETVVTLSRQEIDRLIQIGDTDLIVNLVIGFHGNSSYVPARKRTWFYGKLVGHPDPEVRSMVAECDSVPVKLLRKLAQDEDVNVADQARETLTGLVDGP
jgi:hypothetical protein